MLAADNGHADVVALLLQTQPNMVNNKNEFGNTALMLAARSGHVKIVTMLLNAGAEADMRNRDKQNAEIMAEHAGHTEVVKALKEKRGSKNFLGIF